MPVCSSREEGLYKPFLIIGQPACPQLHHVHLDSLRRSSASVSLGTKWRGLLISGTYLTKWLANNKQRTDVPKHFTCTQRLSFLCHSTLQRILYLIDIAMKIKLKEEPRANSNSHWLALWIPCLHQFNCWSIIFVFVFFFKLLPAVTWGTHCG